MRFEPTQQAIDAFAAPPVKYHLWYNQVRSIGCCVCCLPPNPLTGWRHFHFGEQPDIKESLSWKQDCMLVICRIRRVKDDLRSLFTQAGPVVSAAVITDRDTGTSKGFGFVEMTSQVDAQTAISMFNAYQLGERQRRR